MLALFPPSQHDRTPRPTRRASLGLDSGAQSPSPQGDPTEASAGERPRPLLTPVQLPPRSLRESPNMNDSLGHLGAVFHTGGFSITVTIMGRKALFHVHSSAWATFGFWLISAYLMCKGGFFSKQFHYLAVLVTLKTL